MRKFLAKWVSLVVPLLVFGFFTLLGHEWFQSFAASYFGLNPEMTFHWWGISLEIDTPASIWQDLLIRIVGGWGTALLFGILWVLAHWQGAYSDWELDDCFIFGFLAAWQFIYGITECFGYWLFWFSIIAAELSLGIVILLYARRIWRWLGES